MECTAVLNPDSPRNDIQAEELHRIIEADDLESYLEQYYNFESIDNHLKCACDHTALKIIEYLLNVDVTKQYTIDYIRHVYMINKNTPESIKKCYYLMLPRITTIPPPSSILSLNIEYAIKVQFLIQDILRVCDSDLWKYAAKYLKLNQVQFVRDALRFNLVDCIEKLDVRYLGSDFWYKYTTTDTLHKFLDLYTTAELEIILENSDSAYYIQDYLDYRKSRGTHTKAAISKILVSLRN